MLRQVWLPLTVLSETIIYGHILLTNWGVQADPLQAEPVIVKVTELVQLERLKGFLPRRQTKITCVQDVAVLVEVDKHLVCETEDIGHS